MSAGYTGSHAHKMLIYVSGANYYLSSNNTKYSSIWHKLCSRFLRFEKFPPKISDFCGDT